MRPLPLCLMLVACTTELPADADSTPRSTDMSAGPRLDQGGVAEDAEVGAEDGDASKMGPEASAARIAVIIHSPTHAREKDAG